MTALGGFLLLWTFVVEPALGTDGFNVVGAVAYLGRRPGRVRHRDQARLRRRPSATHAIRLLLVAMALLLATSVVVLLPALDTASLRTSRTAGGLLFALYGVLARRGGPAPGAGRDRRRASAQRTERAVAAAGGAVRRPRP